MSFLAELPPVDSDLADRPTESQQLTCKECQQGARLNVFGHSKKVGLLRIAIS